MTLESNRNKKIIYFLMACDAKGSVSLLKHFSWTRKKEPLPSGVIKKTKRAFERNKKYLSPEEKTFFSPWRAFCKSAAYEEVLLLILYGILEYPKENLPWILNIPIETVSYRIEQGLTLLGEKLGGVPVREDHLKKARNYCRELAKKNLPQELEKIKHHKQRIKIKYLIGGLFALVFLLIVVGVLSLLFSAPQTIILYQSFVQ